MAANWELGRLEVVTSDDAGSSADAFDVVYAEHAHRALRLAGLLCGHRERAEDAVAEAFVKVLPKWRAGLVEDFWSYLRTAIVNEIRSVHRRRGVADRWRHRTHSADRTSGPEDGITERRRVAAALDELPERQRTAVVLRYFEDLSERETAAVMGCGLGTVKSTTSRGVARLRELLGEEDV
jgi:RNA polymerase sigma-70 factor (sigma-E family)